MTKLLQTLIFIALAVVVAAAAQLTISSGKPSELKGVTRIYITASDKDFRDKIAGEIKKKLPQVVLTENAKEAQVWLVFRIDMRASMKNNPSFTESSPNLAMLVGPEYEVIAMGEVFRPTSQTKAHSLMKFKDSGNSILQEKFQIEFADAFVKSYQKANR